MSSKDEALKMAIEALELITVKINHWTDGGNWNEGKKVIEACKQALEQPPPKVEPFDVWAGTKPQEIGEAEIRQMLNDIEYYQKRVEELEQPAQEPVAWMHRHDGEITEFNDFQSCDKCEPLYTHPHQWQGLSAKEIASIPLDEHTVQTVEKILKRKNT